MKKLCHTSPIRSLQWHTWRLEHTDGFSWTRPIRSLAWRSAENYLHASYKSHDKAQYWPRSILLFCTWPNAYGFVTKCIIFVDFLCRPTVRFLFYSIWLTHVTVNFLIIWVDLGHNYTNFARVCRVRPISDIYIASISIKQSMSICFTLLPM